MNTECFNKVVSHRVNTIHSVLAAKASEYARGDRLGNFKRAASMQGVTPEKALVGMKAKHDVALQDFINDLDVGKIQCYERWNEKIGDIINYLILLDGLVQERISEIPGHPELPMEESIDDQITKAIHDIESGKE
jgi:hypothetical protein